MVTYTVNADVGIRDYRGKSTDEKPVEGVPNGSTFYVMDAKEKSLPDTLYMFDADENRWWAQ